MTRNGFLIVHILLLSLVERIHFSVVNPAEKVNSLKNDIHFQNRRLDRFQVGKR